MLQRIQTLYMLIALLVLGAISYYFPIWVDPEHIIFIWGKSFTKVLWMVIMALIAANIFQYKNRKNQFVLNRVAILLNFILFGFCLYVFYIEMGIKDENSFGTGILGPILSIAFLSIANRAIKKDEDLIKSMDRLR